MGKELEADLSNERVEPPALRKALLYLIYLVQENPAPACSNFIEFLLNRFPPLCNHANDNYHSFMFDHDMHAGLIKKGRTYLTLSLSFYDSIMERTKSGELLGEELSIEFYKKMRDYYRHLDFGISAN